MATQVIMPQLGESVVEGTVGRWLKQVGDTVKELEPLLEIESDKVNTEMPSPASGVLLKIYVPEGTTVTAGTVLAAIGQPGEKVDDAPVPAAVHGHSGNAHEEVTPAPIAVTSQAPAPAGRSGNGGPRLSPVVANIAAQHGVDVSKIRGTGQGGRVTKKDIMAYIETGGQTAPAGVASTDADLPPWEKPGSGDLFKPTDDLYKKAQPAATAPAPSAAPTDHAHAAPPSPGKPGEMVHLSTMRRRIAEHMVLSKLQTAPHVTTVFEADLSAIVGHREANKADFASRGVNLTYTAYFVAVTAQALKAHPMVNSQWMGEEGVLLKKEINIGVAVAIDDGLIVPVIKNADELSLQGIARALNDLAVRARASQLKPDEVQGGTFTITNHGVSGSLFATPIINQPQTGILGVGAIQKRVVVLENDAIAVRPMVYIGLTFDHRVLDGAGADWFVAEIKSRLENWQ